MNPSRKRKRLTERKATRLSTEVEPTRRVVSTHGNSPKKRRTARLGEHRMRNGWQ